MAPPPPDDYDRAVAMNYRHAFHAGNFADVFKHAALALMLARLGCKETPFFVLDTHAGAGRYDLAAAEAVRTGEAAAGIGRVLDGRPCPGALAPYLDAVRAANGRRRGLRWYPGSPAIVRRMLRPGDILVACELHPEDAERLAREFQGDARVRVRREDGYGAVKALLPPKERRGLVLIDPPFEEAGEFERMAEALRQGVRRWAGGVYALWYPVKARAPIAAFHAAIAAAGIPDVFAAELLLHRDERADRLNGCGLVVVNPPWTLEESLRDVLPFLAEALAQDEPARWRLERLAEEAGAAAGRDRA